MMTLLLPPISDWQALGKAYDSAELISWLYLLTACLSASDAAKMVAPAMYLMMPPLMMMEDRYQPLSHHDIKYVK